MHREVIEEAIESGLTPLAYMLEILRDPSQPAERRDEMAKAAAPFMHPKLSSIEASGPGGAALQLPMRIERVIIDPANIEREGAA